MTFDDLSASDFGSIVPNGYKGLTFTNLYAINPLLYFSNSGYKEGTISPPNVAYNGFGGKATIFSPVGQEISLASMWVTSAWTNDLNLLIERFDTSGVKVAPDFTTVLLSPYTPKQITFDSTFVASIDISSSGGTYAGLDDNGLNVAIDNIAFFVRPTVI
jgi:hypothetical protein